DAGRAAAAEQLGPVTASEIEVYAGRGIGAVVGSRTVQVGSPAWFTEQGLALPDAAVRFTDAAASSGRASILVSADRRVIGGFRLSDTLNDSAAAGVAALRDLGLSTVLLTGDADAPAREIARRLGIDSVIAGVLPTQKAAAIEALQADGERVAMVGDGINDAAALATADLGMAVVNGTDLAMRSADVVLVRRNLEVIADAVQLSKQTLHTIHGNLIWAFGYNVAAIPLAASGWLNPLIAGFAMSFSSLFVVGNSLRLRSFEPRRTRVVPPAAG
ncbi:MAG: HAD-IC family P-type ATPase, partial [Micropruina sp.]|uniref:heavy metal translocating P-type ATPase n=1 Tax=Micropruina sp. TaxID=2737536 RepID=UPI0039E26377